MWALLGMLLGAAAQAQELPRASPVPGGIAIVPLAPENEPTPTAHFDGNRVMVARRDGRWQAVVGLPLTLTPGTQVVTAGTGQGKIVEYPFTVQAKEYAVQRLTIKNKRMVEPTAEDLARIARETEIIRHVFTIWTEQPASSLRFRLPLRGSISSVFGLQRFFNNEPRQPHSGIDIAGPVGATVVAPFAGEVVETGEYFFNGKTVFIDHGQGLISMFNHFSRITVKSGTRVKEGEKIGEVGMSGRVTGPHLHWSVSLNNSRVDPELFLPEEKSRR